jgi:hypothetical protein
MEALGSPQRAGVLDDDDLLCEILLRVAFPTSLVRAALACKRWLRLASDPAFLRRFGGLHPPRLLGFYVDTTRSLIPRFVPFPQPPELVGVVCRGNFSLDTLGFAAHKIECWNGCLLLSLHVHNQPNQIVRTLRWPLCPARHAAILPPFPDTSIHDGFTYAGVGDGMSFFYLATVSKEQQTAVYVYMLQDHTWAILASAVSEIPEIDRLESTLIGDGKIYSVARVSKIWKLLLLGLVSSTLSLINLPEEVNFLTTRLSLANDSGVHLAHVKDFQIRIWLHRVDNNGVANWTRVNTICLGDMCTSNTIPSHVFEVDDDLIRIYAVGQNCEFVLLGKDNAVYMFDLKLKAAKKVYEAGWGEHVCSVSPFMMVWPPKFPAIMEGCHPN